MNNNHRQLAEAYRNAVYVVFDKMREIRFRVGENSADIDALLKKNGAEKFAFLTAHNPYSEVLPQLENEQRQLRLKQILQTLDFRFLEGYGTDESESWGREDSLFVLNISEADAVKLGKEFGQNAILCGAKDEKCRLIWSEI